MNFQIKNIVIWPKNRKLNSRILNFELGRINVISGASRTGKSAIIPIIDYCLCSSECNIPIDVIRDTAEWYGVRVSINGQMHLICRKTPISSKTSNEIFYLSECEGEIPKEITESNETSDGMKRILNALSGVPYLGLDVDDLENKSSYKSRLSFRDLMALVFQSQEIVASQNILFYKTHSFDHRERLKNWFPYILGAETPDSIQARHELADIETKIRALEIEIKRIQNTNSRWSKYLSDYLVQASQYGLIAPTEVSLSIEHGLQLLKRIIENSLDFPQLDVEVIGLISQKVKEFEKLEEEYSISIAQSKKRLDDIKQLKNNITEFNQISRKRTDRLHISKYISELSNSENSCPICGAYDHPVNNANLKALIAAFEKAEKDISSTSIISNSFLREEELAKKELSGLIFEFNQMKNDWKTIIESSKEINDNFNYRKSMYQFVGKISAIVESFSIDSNENEFINQMIPLSKRKAELRPIIDEKMILGKLEFACRQLSIFMLEHLKEMDVDARYKKMPPDFSINDLNVYITQPDGSRHFLSEVGSASNWVAFHISLICSLQEYFTSLSHSSVPSFVIFDQPSQVYFPKISRSKNNLDPEIQDEDVAAVKSLFTEISKSIKNTKGQWQAIVLDHAGDAIYGEIEDLYEVEIWRGKALIPSQWIED